MPLTVIDEGTNNHIDISPATLAKGQGRLTISGSNNHIRIAETNFNLGLHATLGEGCHLEIGRHVNCINLVTYQARNAKLEIGAHVGFNGQVRLQMHEASLMRIGNGCLFADEVEMTTSDMHSIIDVETSKRVNPARDIVLGDRVWVGQRVIVLKGSQIGDGSIIGAAALVTGILPAQCAAGGNPARVLRTGVTWNFQLL